MGSATYKRPNGDSDSRRRHRGRAVSDLVGYSLLVGMVLASALIAVAFGATVVDDVRQSSDERSAQAVLQETDATLDTLTLSEDAPRTALDFGAGDRNYRLDRAGFFNVTVNHRSACSANVSLSSIQYEADGRTVAYQAGGVFTQRDVGSTALVTEPAVHVRDGTLDVTIHNLTGTLDDDSIAGLNVSSSKTRTRDLNDRLFRGACASPDSITIEVQSPYYDAWARHLAGETNRTVARYEANDTMRVTLPQRALPRTVNESANSVINFSNPGYMDDVTIGGDTISVDKGVDNQYTVSVTSLQSAPPDIGRVQALASSDVSNATRGRIDVVFVMDESGSMGGTKIAEARDAAKAAVGTMNTSVIGDRAALVGYTEYATAYEISESGGPVYFSNDSAAVNNSVDANINAGGSTDLAAGLNRSLALLSFREDPSGTVHVFLLTDGENSPGNKCYDYDHRFDGGEDCEEYFNDRTRNAAAMANSSGYTIHSFAYGSGADEDLLEEVAEKTVGGTYHEAADGDELQSIFTSVIGNITGAQDYVTRTPLSTNFTTGDGSVHAPQIAGDTDGIATNSSGGTTFLNINDPTAPSLFSHSFAVSGGETVVINSATYECAEGSWASTGLVEERGGETYPVARCTNMTVANETLDPGDITVSRDGEDATWLMTSNATNATLDPYVNDSTDRFSLKSNQVIVTFDYEDSPNSKNRLILRYDVGRAESDAKPGDVINLQVRDIEVG